MRATLITALFLSVLQATNVVAAPLSYPGSSITTRGSDGSSSVVAGVLSGDGNGGGLNGNDDSHGDNGNGGGNNANSDLSANKISVRSAGPKDDPSSLVGGILSADGNGNGGNGNGDSYGDNGNGGGDNANWDLSGNEISVRSAGYANGIDSAVSGVLSADGNGNGDNGNNDSYGDNGNNNGDNANGDLSGNTINIFTP